MFANPKRQSLLARTFVVAAISAVLVATGCNTVKGVGRDIEAAGDKTQKAINND